jgi:hypothetical protein
MKKVLIAIVFFIVGVGFPAYAVEKKDFNFVKTDAKVDNMNKIIYLEARVKELEKELETYKLSKEKTFGLAYIDKEGNLRCKAEDGGKDWDWNGKTWTRQEFFKGVTSGTSTPDCPTGNCPLPRR